MTDTNDTYSRRGNIVIGVMLVLVGVALTLDRAGLLDWSNQFTLWPIILCGIGLARFVGSPAGEPKQGLLFLTVGGWLLLGEARVVSVEDSWPILIIALGLVIALNGGTRRRWPRPGHPGVPGNPMRPGHGKAPGTMTGMAVIGIWILVFVAFQNSGIRTLTETTSSDRLRVVSVAGRAEHASRAEAFRGADVTNVMGRAEIDLRDATLAPGTEASVRVVSAMGAVILRVPPGWTVDTGAVTALGAVRDERSRSPDDDAAAKAGGPRPRLVLRGVIMFGRLSIRS